MQIDRLESMLENAVSFDTETWLIKPGLAAPRMVCWSAGWYDQDAKQCVGQIGSRDEGEAAFERILDDESIILTVANGSFDIVVMLVHMARLGKDVFPLVRKMLEDGRVFDIQLAEQLHAIAMGHLGKDPRTKQDIVNPETGKKGRYSLAACVDMVLGRGDAKANDEWRLRYAELDGIPIDQWPSAARDYPVDDARNTLECALAQTGHLPRVVMQHAWEMQPSGANTCVRCGKETFGGTCWDHQANQNLHDLAHQQRANTALALAGAWGFRVDQSKVDVIEKHAIKNRDDGAGPFVEAGIIRKDGTENQAELKRRVAVAYGAKTACPVCTGTGKVPSPSAKAVRCRKCKGAGLNCDECRGEGKKVYALINCCEVPNPSNPKGKIKTCDGTGLLLTDDVPRTDGNGVGVGRDLLYESGDPTLQAYAEYCADDKVLATYVPYLRGARTCTGCGAAGTEKSPHTDLCPARQAQQKFHYKDVPLTLSYNSLVESGRVSASGALQLFPRWPGYWDNDAQEYVPSLRECLIPREGCLFGSTDYHVGELFSHAQSCLWLLGYSDLAKTLLAGRDPHSEGAATIMGVSYDEFMRLLKEIKDPTAKGLRQGFKPFNFGKPTGMGDVKVCLTARRQGENTPCPNGPMDVMVDGKKVRGYPGTRFCIIVDGADRCGELPDGTPNRVNRWGAKGREQEIPPTCAHCLEVATRLGKAWKYKNKENVPYGELCAEFMDYGMTITPEALDRWPHLRPYFEAGMQTAPGQIMQHVTGRLRTCDGYSELANSFFQGLIGDITKEAFWRVTVECLDRTYRVPDMAYENSRRSRFANGSSPLYGSHAIGFFHDECFTEHPESVAPEAGVRVQEIMEETARWYMPDLAEKVKAEPTLMRAWRKDASYVKDANGRLAVWEPPPIKKAA